jgi:hypothetical protein
MRDERRRTGREVHDLKRAEHGPPPLWKASLLAFGVTWLAALVRWWPLTQYAVWGSDQGQYGALVDNYVANGGQLSATYLGWGAAYPDFPGLFSFAGAFASISGVDAFLVLSIVVPAAAALTALLAFAMALRLSGSLRAATLAGAIVATAMPEAFAGSHGMPGALGGMLALAIMVAVVVSGRAPGARYVALALCLALVPTHHLSAFLAFAALAGAAVLEARLAPADSARSRIVDSALLSAAALLLLSAAYWSLGATNFRTIVLDRASPWLGRSLLGLAIFAVIALVVLVWYVETAPHSHKGGMAVVDDRTAFKRFLQAAGLAAISIAVVATVGVPGTSVVIPAGAAVAFLPLAFVLSAAGVGVGRLAPVRGALVLFGAIAGLLLSMVIGAALLPTVLLPYRHLQYLVDVAAPLSAVALSFAARSLAIEAFPERHKFQRPLTAVLLSALVLSCAATAYPSKEAFGGFQEGTTSTETAAIVWMQWNVPRTVVASDHRLSSLAFGYANQEATWEASAALLEGDLLAAQSALNTTASPAGHTGVTIVLLSKDVIAGAALSQWAPARPLSPEALGKFSAPPFVRVFDDGDAVAYWVARPA